MASPPPRRGSIALARRSAVMSVRHRPFCAGRAASRSPPPCSSRSPPATRAAAGTRGPIGASRDRRHLQGSVRRPAPGQGACPGHPGQRLRRGLTSVANLPGTGTRSSRAESSGHRCHEARPRREVIWSTYLGGNDARSSSRCFWGDTPQDIAVDPQGNVYVVGWTGSTDFPTVNAVIPQAQVPRRPTASSRNSARTAAACCIRPISGLRMAGRSCAASCRDRPGKRGSGPCPTPGNSRRSTTCPEAPAATSS